MCKSKSQKIQEQAAQSQGQLANTLQNLGTQYAGMQTPFLQSRIQKGLPFLPQLITADSNMEGQDVQERG